MTSLKSRVLVMIVGVPLLAWVVLAAPAVVLKCAVGVLALIGAYELMKCIGAETKSFLTVWTMVCAMATVILPAQYVALGWLIYVILAFLMAIIRAGEVKFLEIAAGICAVIVIPYAFAAFLRIEAMGLHRAYLLLPFILSFACDTFAYIVGCTIGKHKLAPKVSPKKSVEGSIGGLVGNVLCGLVFAFVMDRCFGSSVGYGAMTVLALACGVVAQIGDLSFSLIKREFGVKDYGKLFLAHGGVLDRFDSVLFVAPVIELILNFVK